MTKRRCRVCGCPRPPGVMSSRCAICLIDSCLTVNQSPPLGPTLTEKDIREAVRTLKAREGA